MTGAHRAALLAPLAALSAQLGTSPAQAGASDSLSTELNRCVAISSAEARLACYDKLAGRSAASATTGSLPAAASPTPTASAPAMPASTGPAAAAPAAATTVTAAPAPAPAPVPAAAAAVAPPDAAAAARNFGLSSAQLHSAPQGPQSIEARVSEVGVDRGLRSYVVLDNGQTWLSTDGGMELNSGEPVTIKHAALGSFMLLAPTSNHSYHVHRIR